MSISADVRKFNKELAAFAATLEPQHIVPFTKKIAFQVLEGVIFNTPVDTGRARGNWLLEIGSEPKEEVDRFGSGAHPEATEGNVGPAGSAARDAGLGKLSTLKPFVPIYITNNVPYIMALEEGHSKQIQPHQMIKGTLDRVKAQFP